MAAFIPALRWFERRWIGLDDDHAADEAYCRRLPGRDTVGGCGLMAIGLPFGLTLIFKGCSAFLNGANGSGPHQSLRGVSSPAGLNHLPVWASPNGTGPSGAERSVAQQTQGRPARPAP